MEFRRVRCRSVRPADGEEELHAGIEEKIQHDVEIAAEVARSRMAGDRAIEAVGEAVQQDERQRCRVALQRQQRPGAATDDEAAPGDTVGGDATAREAPPESLERRVDELSQAGVENARLR